MNPNRWRQAIATASLLVKPRHPGLRYHPHHRSLCTTTKTLEVVSFTRAFLENPLAMTRWIGNRSSSSKRRCFSSQADTTSGIGNKEDQDVTSESTSTAKNTNSSKGKKKSKRRSWGDYLRDLATFQQTEGHARVPHAFPQDPSLAYFVRRNRKYPEKLTTAQRGQLDALGFSWETQPARNERQWADKFRELQDFGRDHNHLNVPRKYDKNPSLGLWVNRQRCLQRQGLLPQDRWQKMEDIGFSWRHGGRRPPLPQVVQQAATNDRKWQRQYDKLVAYHLETGNCMVPARYDQDQSLGNWVVAQRSLHRKGLLKTKRIRLLEALPFVFDPR